MSKVEFYQEDGAMRVSTTSTDWRWRVKAGNGEIVASGEGYTTRTDAKRGIADAFDSMRFAYLNFRETGA
jgi:hypothetical protein